MSGSSDGTYYNEIDPKAATWLRQLIVNGDIPAGEVDERDIRDVRPDDLRAFRHLHLFAGIGGWALALRLAGWPDDRPVLTVSCPCPSFSAAGTGSGFADERHLWPAAFWLIAQLQPPTVFGEQVEAAVRHGWLDLVQDDLEGIGYASRAVVLPAASVGAPHIRQRLWFVADTEYAKRREVCVDREDGRNGPDSGRKETHGEPRARGQVRELADAQRRATERHGYELGGEASEDQGREEERQRVWDDVRDGKSTGELADTDRLGARRVTGAMAGAERAETSREPAPWGSPQTALHSGSVRELADTTHADRRRGERRTEAGVGPVGERGRGSASRSDAGDVADPTLRGQREHGCASGGAGHVDERESVELMGHPNCFRPQGRLPGWTDAQPGTREEWPAVGRASTGVMGDSDGAGHQKLRRRRNEHEGSTTADIAGVMGNTDRGRREVGGEQEPRGVEGQRWEQPHGPSERRAVISPWADLVWLPCRDGKARPTQSGLQPLVARVPGGVVPSGDPSESEADATAEARVMRLKGYGNAIVPQVAAEVIRAYLDTE